MSQLREQLEEARETYLAARYPGELASQVLLVRRDWWWKLMGTAVAGAAAAIVVAVLVREPALEERPCCLAAPTRDDTSVELRKGLGDFVQRECDPVRRVSRGDTGSRPAAGSFPAPTRLKFGHFTKARCRRYRGDGPPRRPASPSGHPEETSR